MKLNLTVVYFLSEAAKQATIKATDAKTVAATLDKLDKEYERLQKATQAKATA